MSDQPRKELRYRVGRFRVVESVLGSLVLVIGISMVTDGYWPSIARILMIALLVVGFLALVRNAASLIEVGGDAVRIRWGWTTRVVPVDQIRSVSVASSASLSGAATVPVLLTDEGAVRLVGLVDSYNRNWERARAISSVTATPLKTPW